MIIYEDKKIAVITDTSSDLTDELIDSYGIYMVSLNVICQRGEFRDRLEITSDEVYTMLKRELPKSSLPFAEDIGSLYNRLIQQGCTDILHICISSGLSGTYGMTSLVADEFRDKVRVFVYDSKTLSAGLGLLVMEACRVLKKTGDPLAAMEQITRIRESQLGCFVIKTLEYLRKGGRIGLVEGAMGALLQIKPVIFVNPNGVYQTLVKARGFTAAIDVMLDEVYFRYKDMKIRLAIVHGQARDEAEKILERLKGKLTIVDSYIASVSPVLAIHTGPGLLGIIAQEY